MHTHKGKNALQNLKIFWQAMIAEAVYSENSLRIKFSTEPFLSGLQKMGVQLLWDAENFHSHAVFIAQNMLD